jgi:hypothetical protein
MQILDTSVSALNLTAWFLVTPPAAAIPSYTVLEEAMERQTALLHETGEVNELLIENTGDEDLFIQAGDIVKGGRQDRTLGADFIVPARSGRVPVPAFCVEAARWSRRGAESHVLFSKSSHAVSSKKLRRALRESKSQSDVWDSVAEEQAKVSAVLCAPFQSADSPTSLQLSYELGEMQAALADYLGRFEAVPGPEVSGVVWAINGAFSHADLYVDPVLFRKMWKKLLRAAALEAIAERAQPAAARPVETSDVARWLDGAKAAPAEVEGLPPRTRLTTRRAPSQLRWETQDTAVPGTIHLSLLVNEKV